MISQNLKQYKFFDMLFGLITTYLANDEQN